MIYLHIISHRTSNSSFYARLCETAVVARLLRGTGGQHGAEPPAGGHLAALPCATRGRRAGLEAGTGTHICGCPTAAASLCLFPPAPWGRAAGEKPWCRAELSSDVAAEWP